MSCPTDFKIKDKERKYLFKKMTKDSKSISIHVITDGGKAEEETNGPGGEAAC